MYGSGSTQPLLPINLLFSFYLFLLIILVYDSRSPSFASIKRIALSPAFLSRLTILSTCLLYTSLSAPETIPDSVPPLSKVPGPNHNTVSLRHHSMSTSCLLYTSHGTDHPQPHDGAVQLQALLYPRAMERA